ncbi:hypothetical protein ADINL_2290 [Nitrincola lacisaponensis]|uniref:DUF5610 domain-containing protein n=1 Tax=Nitrincola lacisaponensis TaxID=267850 RepID=A0A063Y310_9GAMM|nr:DUF5610 domain-containing protein [Nitrincola lacisaponensis]KDE39161.1 hypothetical protein ADINL_2290 [Nitrincola lacisaponensis]
MTNINAYQPSLLRSGDGKQSAVAANRTGSGPVLNQLQTQILETLSQHIPGMSLDGMKKLDANQFTPEKVAERISQFVANGMELARARGESEEKIQQLYDRAMKGVEQGFREAKEILNGLGVLQGKIATDVARTEELTFEKLRALSPEQRTAMEMVSLSVAQRYERADSFELNITTREGDEVRIRFDRSDSFQYGFGAAMDGQGNAAMVFDMSRTQSSGFSFSVEGNLSVEEIDAIQNLIRDIGQLADDFFKGDVQGAFEQVGELTLDTTQLSAFSLSLSRTEVRSVAAQYQQTQQLTDADAEERPGRRLGQLMQQLKEQINSPLLAFVEQQVGFGKSLMQSLVEQDVRFKQADAPQQAKYQDNLGRLLQTLDQTSAS